MEDFLVKPGKRIDLRSVDPRCTGDYLSKDEARHDFAVNYERIGELEGRLFCEKKHALLIVLQGMDAGGKDGTIKHVVSAVSPSNCEITSFNVPAGEELDHDFLWRVYKRLPRRGTIGVFNRSHYEDVLAARVRKIVPEQVWRRRYRQINTFERLVSDLGTKIVKIFLHISKDEQRRRLEERLHNPAKSWKYQPGDLEDRKHWGAYLDAYEDAFFHCNTQECPWHIVPADKKWYRNLVVSQLVVKALESIKPVLPRIAQPRKIRIPD